MIAIVWLVLWIIAVLLIAAALLGLVRAVLGLSLLAPLSDFREVIYALFVLVIVVLVVSALFGVGPLPRPPHWGG